MQAFFQVMLAMSLCGAVYGRGIRPWITRQRFFHEVLQVTSHQVLAIPIACEGTRVLTIDHKVLAGPPVTIFLVSAEQFETHSSQGSHVPAASSFCSLSASKRVVLPPGRWALAITPHSPVTGESSEVLLRLSLSQRPLLESTSACTPCELPFEQERPPLLFDTDDPFVLQEA